MEETVVTTETTSPGIITNAINGTMKLVTGEAPTSGEHVASALLLNGLNTFFTAKYTRQRAAAGKPPVFGILF